MAEIILLALGQSKYNLFNFLLSCTENLFIVYPKHFTSNYFFHTAYCKDPCLNNGTCLDGDSCKCQDGFMGRTCARRE